MPGRDSERRVDLTKRLARKGPRKLLALDGGGIRGVLSLHILGRIEELLIKESKRPDYRLADYFDYVAGTSTGGIIAAGIALGMSVAEILDFYVKNGAAMFDKASIMRRLRYEYNSEPLAKQLKRVFGEDTTLGAKELECLLLLVMRNATTDSPWPLCNNPFAKYNDPAHPACNTKLPLWQLVRASTAAPTYFPPGSHYVWRQIVHFCRRRRDHVQQSDISDVSDGDGGSLLDQGAAGKPRLGDGHG